MKKARMERMSYCIHSFMCEELGLGGSELLIYAIIYSFTKGERGLYYGAQDFLARASGLSLSTVKRSLASLLKGGLIEKCRYEDRDGYRSIDPPEHKNTTSNIDEPPNDAESDLPSPHVMAKLGIRAPQLIAPESERPKYEFHPVGKEDIVSMTAEQYKRLLSLVNSEVLSTYIRRLELLIRDDGYRTFSPYKTIKKWILDDASV